MIFILNTLIAMKMPASNTEINSYFTSAAERTWILRMIEIDDKKAVLQFMDRSYDLFTVNDWQFCLASLNFPGQPSSFIVKNLSVCYMIAKYLKSLEDIDARHPCGTKFCTILMSVSADHIMDIITDVRQRFYEKFNIKPT